jgi:transcriptional regulator with XRE-family HTH domain
VSPLQFQRHPIRDSAASVASANTGLTQHQLAFEAEIDLTYMRNIECGRRNPSLLVMARITEALSVPLPKLLSE